jgi:hypothetical protein
MDAYNDTIWILRPLFFVSLQTVDLYLVLHRVVLVTNLFYMLNRWVYKTSYNVTVDLVLTSADGFVYLERVECLLMFNLYGSVYLF